MAIRRYLAMTAAEIGKISEDWESLAWMACHFSPYGRGLSNLPRALPAQSLLIVDDITPIHGHDPEIIGAQLTDCAEQLGCSAVLLDFQRSGYEENGILAKHLSQVLPCPVGVSEAYAVGLDCAVFLPPVPCHTPLTEYLAPWEGREIWLDMALDGVVLTVKENGTEHIPMPYPNLSAAGFAEEKLHCHYKIEKRKDAVVFTLWRTLGDLEALLEDAGGMGVAVAVGLYQELGELKKNSINANQGLKSSDISGFAPSKAPLCKG